MSVSTVRRAPEQIAGWLKSGAEQLRAINHEDIYAWIYGRSQRQAKLWRLLPRKKSKRGFRPARKPGIAIRDRSSIHDRPEAVKDRAEGGHCEGDLLIYKKTRLVLVLACLAKDRDVLLAFYDFPAEHWKHICTRRCGN